MDSNLSAIDYSEFGIEGKILSTYPRYVIQKDGQVYSLSKKRLINQFGTDYLRVTIIVAENGKRKSTSRAVHRLVAQAYIENPNNFSQVDHLDGNKKNNVSSNLEWVTREENAKRSHQDPRRKNTKTSVCQYEKDGTTLRKYESITEATKTGEFKLSSIGRACNGTIKSQFHKGYIWRYDDSVIEKSKKKRQEDKPREGEVWLIHPDHPNYECSSYGRVRNKKTKRCLVLQLVNGYYFVGIQINNSRKSQRVNILICQVFNGPPLPEIKNPIVNHRDGNKLNNNKDNLEWCTVKDNSKHAHKMNLNLSSKPCIQYSLSGEVINYYKSIRKAHKITGVCKSGIDQVCNHRKKYNTAGGYIWRFIWDPL
jgi:hypothetical protein